MGGTAQSRLFFQAIKECNEQKAVELYKSSEELQALDLPTEYYIINVYITTICINSCSVYSYNVTDTNITITELSPINEYYTVTIIPVNVIGYGPSVTVNGT